MFAGHLAVGFAGKRIEPEISLGTWMTAVMLQVAELAPAAAAHQ